VEDNLCHFPLSGKVANKCGGIEYLGEKFDGKGRKFLKDFSSDKVIPWRGVGLEVFNDGFDLCSPKSGKWGFQLVWGF
jgi:hypothetical protein